MNCTPREVSCLDAEGQKATRPQQTPLAAQRCNLDPLLDSDCMVCSSALGGTPRYGPALGKPGSTVTLSCNHHCHLQRWSAYRLNQYNSFRQTLQPYSMQEILEQIEGNDQIIFHNLSCSKCQLHVHKTKYGGKHSGLAALWCGWHMEITSMKAAATT